VAKGLDIEIAPLADRGGGRGTRHSELVAPCALGRAAAHTDVMGLAGAPATGCELTKSLRALASMCGGLARELRHLRGKSARVHAALPVAAILI
jgi:hypothetical protein